MKNNDFLKRIDFLPLGANSSLHLVRIGQSKVALLGVSANQTTLLSLTDADELLPLQRALPHTKPTEAKTEKAEYLQVKLPPNPKGEQA